MTADSWQQWEGRVVGGRFALGQYLGGSDHSAVYVTDFGGSRAAVKLVPADTAEAQEQLARWEGAQKLAHPNLLRVYDTGRWHADEEQDMFFAVMEYADENLGEILAERALTPAEVHEMLAPTLASIEHLHGQNLVHGDLKPSNMLAVGSELKLGVDGVRRIGSRLTGREQEDWRAAPEVLQSSVSARTDIWALGLLLVESLTRQRETWKRSDDSEIKLPDGLPEPFASIAKECLQRDPAKRCSIAEIRTMLARPVEVEKPEAQVVPMRPESREGKDSATPVGKEELPMKRASSTAEAEPTSHGRDASAFPVAGPAKVAGAEADKIASRETKSGKESAKTIDVAPRAEREPSSEGSERNRRFVPFAIALLVGIVALFALARFFSHRSSDVHRVPVTTTTVGKTETAPFAPKAAPAQPASRPTAGTVAHQVMPEVSRAAQSSIHGVVKVRVQANVNEAGEVTLAGLSAHGPSRYFAKQALEAARQWTFTPPVVNGKPVTSRWNIEFDFRRSGVKTESKMASPRV